MCTRFNAEMARGKRGRDDEELVALPSDDSEEEEEYVDTFFFPCLGRSFALSCCRVEIGKAMDGSIPGWFVGALFALLALMMVDAQASAVANSISEAPAYPVGSLGGEDERLILPLMKYADQWAVIGTRTLMLATRLLQLTTTLRKRRRRRKTKMLKRRMERWKKVLGTFPALP